MIKQALTTGSSIIALAIGGCASVQPRGAFPEVAATIQKHTGAFAVWNVGGEADTAVAASLRELLSHDLTADAAVQVALLNNRSLQATYEELGIAQAELVQAGLLTNPVFSALLRFPDAARGNPNLELSVSQNFIELLSMPLRKKVAAAQYESTKARVAGEVIALAADVKAAYFTLLGAQQMLELRRTVADAAAASTDAAERLREAGNITELALANEQASQAQAKLDVARVEIETVKARERLLMLLGMSGLHNEVTIAARLPEMPAAESGIDDVESLAVAQRLDLAASVSDLDALYQTLGVATQFAWLGDAELTVETEHETDGSWLTGPGISVPVPIFDTGAAKSAVARARVRQAKARLYALAVQVHSEARSAKAELLAARARVDLYRTTVLPLRMKITAGTQLQFNGMLVGVFQLLQAKRDEIDAGRDYIEALCDYWLARTDLERAVGGRIPVEPASTPTVNSIEPTRTPTHEHQH